MIHRAEHCPGKEQMVKDARDLDACQFRRLVTRRARQIVDPSLGPASDEDTRRELEHRIEEHFEEVGTCADFLPARFLADGAAKLGAVCRVSTPTSCGTGFLVGRSYLMTSNCVLGSVEEAEQSMAEFGFEDNQPGKRVGLEPGRLFITSSRLDFTIVGCDEQALPDVEPIPLLRSPATVTRHERVNIIQVPSGRPQEAALLKNQVTRVKDKVIHYRTSSQLGSPGSPVFNHDWDLVALHHASWSEGDGTAMNEGIRISAIVSHLVAHDSDASLDRCAARAVLGPITDTSPFLGFFDLYGVVEPGSPDIRIPDFAGCRHFADVGIWNLKHFDGCTAGQWIEDLPNVMARLALDVLGLVEIEPGLLDRVVAALGHRGFGLGYVVPDVPGSQGLAILYDRDTTTVTLRQDVYERQAALLQARTPSGRFALPSSPLFAECVVRNGEGSVRFLMIVTHLKAFGDVQSRARQRQMAESLAVIIEDIRERERLPIVLGGTFSERLDNDLLSALNASPDLFSLTADNAAADAVSYIGDCHRSLIDHIVVSRDTYLGKISGDDTAFLRLDRSIRDITAGVSDQVPVVFRLVYRAEPVESQPSAWVPGFNILLPEAVARHPLSCENSKVEALALT